MRIMLPISSWLPRYERSWLRADIMAGLTIMALLVPEGMAYAELAGVGPEAAFYAAPIGLLLYAIFGTSRQLVVAVSSAIAVMSASIIAEQGAADAAEFAALTALLAMLAGAVLIIGGLLRLGSIARFFSGSVLTGFVSGLALVIIVKQLPKIFGIEGGEGNVWGRIADLVRHLDETHTATLLVGGSTLVLMWVLERWFHRIPAALVALVYGILVVSVFGLEPEGVHVVGELPSGLALPSVPDVTLDQVIELLPGAMAIGLVMFAEAVGPAQSFAREHDYPINEDQEMVGIGMANLGAGFFQGFSIGASLSKSAAANAAGARTQVSGVVAAVATALVALFLTPLFENLPEATLGGIVVVAVLGMFKYGEMRRLWGLRKLDFWLAITALVGVLTFEVLAGLTIAVLASFAAVILRSREPRLTELGRLAGTSEFRGIDHHPEARPREGVLILRPDEPVYFVNAESIREAVWEAIDSTDRPTEWLVLDLEMTADLDVPAAEMLEALDEELRNVGMRLHVTGLHREAALLLESTGVLAKLEPDGTSTDVFHALLALEEGGEKLAEADLETILARIAQLDQVLRATRPGDEEQRRALRSALTRLTALTEQDDQGEPPD